MDLNILRKWKIIKWPTGRNARGPQLLWGNASCTRPVWGPWLYGSPQHRLSYMWHARTRGGAVARPAAASAAQGGGAVSGRWCGGGDGSAAHRWRVKKVHGDAWTAWHRDDDPGSYTLLRAPARRRPARGDEGGVSGGVSVEMTTTHGDAAHLAWHGQEAAVHGILAGSLGRDSGRLRTEARPDRGQPWRL
jgi:hypothetical protein